MTEAEIRTIIFEGLKRIAPEADPASLDAHLDVRQTLDIDSYDFLMFLIGLDEKLGVEIPEADYGKLISIDDMVDYLAARIPREAA